jgi:exonuclease III
MVAIHILQWNSISLRARKNELTKFLSETKQTPDFICIQESWLKPGNKFHLPGYTILRNDRLQSGSGGGVATFVRNGINFTKFNFNNCLECIGIFFIHH